MVELLKPPNESEFPDLPGYPKYDGRAYLTYVTSISVGIGTLSVLLRLVSRRINGQPWWWDDAMIIWSGVSFPSQGSRPHPQITPLLNVLLVFFFLLLLLS